MKRKCYTILLIGILFLSIPAFGQKTVVVVEPDEGLEIGALNDAIEGALDPGNTIFELRRGGHYLLNGSIAHVGYTLHIRAEAGEGPRPLLQPAVDNEGASAIHFAAGGGLILEDIYLYGLDELGVDIQTPVNIVGDPCKAHFSGCYFDYSNQMMVRTASTGHTIIIDNCIARNTFRRDSPGNGRVVDTRGQRLDSIVIRNSTLYNNSNMVIRYGSGFVKYVEVDHNTVFQHNLWEAMTIESTWEAKVTNNIFYNFAFRNRNIQHYSLFEMDSTGTKGTGDFGTYLDEDRVIDFSNNNWYIDPKYGDIISDYSDYLINTFGQDTLMYSGGGAPYPMPYRWILRDGVFANEALLDTQTIWWPLKPKVLHFIENGQVDTVNIFRERLWFDNPPPEWEEYFTAFVNRNWSFAGWTEIPNHWVDEDPVMMNEVDNPYTFRYNDNSKSATAAEDGGPLGDPRWVPYPTVSTEKINTAPKSMVRAYPNPCQEQLSFEITANAASMVRIRIYDLTGKEVLSINENLSQGLNTIPVSLSRISQPGIYMYQVKLTGQANTISTGKLVKR